MALTKRTPENLLNEKYIYFITIISGVFGLALLVTSEPVCYTRKAVDDRNTVVKLTDCNGDASQICRRFASRRSVNMFDIIGSPCDNGEENVTSSEGSDQQNDLQAITCSTTNLPTVKNGSFDCPPNFDVSKGDNCTVSCDDGFYPASPDVASCESGTDIQGGKWSDGNFTCHAITCSTTNLPTVKNGSFDCHPNFDVSKDDNCSLSCDDGFYPASPDVAWCESGIAIRGGQWSDGNFTCHAITCSTTNLPTVKNGSFVCPPSPNVSQGDNCTLSCDDGFYPAFTDAVSCEAGIQEGKWSDGNFTCHAVTCSTTNLPTVNNGSFDCPPNLNVSKGDNCTLSCYDGFYSASLHVASCEAETNIQGGKWSDGYFTCQEVKCFKKDLPQLMNGSYHCPSGNVTFEGGVCILTCDDGFYPSPNRAACRAGNGENGGEWFGGSFTCRLLDCNEWNEWGESEYQVINTQHTWHECRQLCVNDSSHLVTIENKEENDFVHMLALDCTTVFCYIGLNHSDTEGEWQWVDHTDVIYTNWGIGQPGGWDEECAYMDMVSGNWSDYYCTHPRKAICERERPLM